VIGNIFVQPSERCDSLPVPDFRSMSENPAQKKKSTMLPQAKMPTA